MISRRPGAWTRRVRKALLALAAPTVVILGAEGLLRLLGAGHPPGFLVRAEDGSGWVHNPRCAWGFFPPAIARGPQPVWIPDARAEGARRILVVGESTAMGFPQPSIGFPRLLEATLNHEDAPPVEVINLAITAATSELLVPLARDAMAKADPDLLVVAMGHNEYIGPYGVGSRFRRWRLPAWTDRAHLAAHRLRLVQVLHRWQTRRLLPGDWHGPAALVGAEAMAGDPRRVRVERRFETNLTRLVRAARRRGIPTALVTLPVNLIDQPPLGRSDPHATEAFRDGRAAAAADDFATARRRLAAARDLDPLPMRSTSAIHAAIRQVAGRENVPCLDLAAAFEEAGDWGWPVFFEHVHLTRLGHARIAERLADAIGEAWGLPPPSSPRSLDALCQALGDTAAHRAEAAAGLRSMLARPPFQGQSLPPGLTAFLSQAALLDLPAQAWPEDVVGEADRFAEAALVRTTLPDLAWATAWFRFQKDWGRAAEGFDRLLAKSAQEPEWALGRAEAAFGLGDLERALAESRRAARLAPWWEPGRMMEIEMLYRSRQDARATRALSRWVRRYPDFPQASFALARILAFHEEPSVRSPRRSLRLARHWQDREPASAAEWAEIRAAAEAARGNWEQAVDVLRRLREDGVGTPEERGRWETHAEAYRQRRLVTYRPFDDAETGAPTAP